MKKFSNNLLRQVGASTALMLLCEMFKLGKLHFIVGSHAAFFSLNQCISPLIGSCGLLSTSLVFFMRSAATTFSAPHLGMLLLVYHIPTFLGALAFSSPTRNKRIALITLVLLCIALFIAHPVGLYAAPYTLLWFIPLILLITRKTNTFSRALTSTFITHAAGSVIMLYTTDTLTAAQWISIMPVALIERFVFAVGTTICYYSIQRIYTLLRPSLRQGFGGQASVYSRARSRGQDERVVEKKPVAYNQ